MNYPRVTEILKAYSNYHNVPPLILERAASRGTTVHALCAGIAGGAWIPDAAVKPEHLGYVNSFRVWSDAQVKSYELIEKRMQDEELGYTGQLDFVIRATDDKLYLADIKTSSKPQKTYPVQMAAYVNLLKLAGISVEGAFLVYLNKDGDFPDIDALTDLSQEFRVFQSALECWNYFNKRKVA